MGLRGFGRHYISADGIENIESAKVTIKVIAEKLEQFWEKSSICKYSSPLV